METHIKTIITLGLFLIASVFLNSCDEKEGEENGMKSHFKYGDNTFDLSQGFFRVNKNKTSSKQGYLTQLALSTSGLAFGKDGSFNGKGSGILFSLYASDTTALVGTYHVDTAGTKSPSFFSALGGEELVYNNSVFPEKYKSIFLGIKSGSITISKKGEEYEITFDCTVPEVAKEKKLTGYYKGGLKSL